MNKRLGIMDIGSNSVRLVIYEELEGLSHRVIHESKKTLRLIEKMDAQGRLPVKAIEDLAQHLNHFSRICGANETGAILAVATAAVRNAANTAEITELVRKLTGLQLEVASDEDEARYGFIGTINSIAITDGFLIDIGGGSTEITLFRARRSVSSVSFPFGAVNTAKRFCANGTAGPDTLEEIRRMVENSLKTKPWLSVNPGMPLVALGGTARTAAKLVQRKNRYPLHISHNFHMTAEQVTEALRNLVKDSTREQSRLDAVGADRADIIVPGLAILQTVFRYIHASEYVVSGSGLREGIYYETVRPEHPYAEDMLENSITGLLKQFPSVPLAHVRHVDRLALRIFDALAKSIVTDSRSRTCLHAAALLHRIGMSVSCYSYHSHTFYLMTNVRINGLSHREIVISALTASYKRKKKTRKLWQAYRSLLSESDLHTVLALGTLLRVAAALDSSEDQQVEVIEANLDKKTLHVHLRCSRYPEIELSEAMEVAEDFKKIWGLTLRFHVEGTVNN